MAANADDLKHFYAERIGISVILSVGDAASVPLAAPLAPGRYRLSTKVVAGGATLLWVRQGPFAGLPDAVAAAPLLPIDLLEDPRFKPIFIARPPGQGNVGPATASDGLTFITDAGTVDVVITRISADG
ncbi:MAG: hypothetical protein O7G84_01180 [Gammaproteobacteria bacterium]|nr:hypothetical protein [Gammaproteobacteria bacterium]